MPIQFCRKYTNNLLIICYLCDKFYDMTKISKTLLTSVAFFAAFSIILSTSCKREDFKRVEGVVWATSYHITYEGAEELQDSILHILRNVELSASAFDDSSLVSLINANKTDSLDFNLLTLLKTSMRINKLTLGAFDPTVGPLVAAWGFGKSHEISADTTAIDSVRAFTGMDKINIVGDHIVKSDPRIRLDFSSIAKGYGCDCIGEMFKRNGVENYLIEIGGEVAAAGKSPRGDHWQIAIDKPQFDSASQTHQAQEAIAITNCGVATSGNYRNFKETDKGRIGHIIDPVSGRPSTTDVVSASIVASTAMEADAFATACMVLGSEKSKQMALKCKLAVYLILADSTVWSSPEFEKLIVR